MSARLLLQSLPRARADLDAELRAAGHQLVLEAPGAERWDGLMDVCLLFGHEQVAATQARGVHALVLVEPSKLPELRPQLSDFVLLPARPGEIEARLAALAVRPSLARVLRSKLADLAIIHGGDIIRRLALFILLLCLTLQATGCVLTTGDAGGDGDGDGEGDGDGDGDGGVCTTTQASYDTLVVNTACSSAEDCHMVEGHCSVGLGDCYYAVNVATTQDALDALASTWSGGECTGAVCDCLATPESADCVDDLCVAVE